MNAHFVIWRAVALLGVLLAGGCATRVDEGLARIEYIVVIYAENRSFDHLYGLFPGAEGLAQASAEQKIQLDHDGKPLPHLPPVYQQGAPHPRFPEKLSNGPLPRLAHSCLYPVLQTFQNSQLPSHVVGIMWVDGD